MLELGPAVRTIGPAREPGLVRNTSHGSLIRSTSIYAAFELGAKLVHIAVTVWLTHVLTQAQFGAYGLLVSLAALLGLLVTFGLHGAANRWYFDTDEARFRRLVFTLLATVVVAGVALAAVLDRLGLRYFDQVLRDVAYAPAGRPALIAAVGLGVTAIPVAVLVARRQATRASLVNVCITLLPLAGVVAAVSSAPAPVTLDRVLQGYMLGALACAGVGVAVALSMASPGFEVGELRRALAFGLPMVPHLAAHWVLSASDRYLIERLRTTAEIAPYHLAYLFGYAVLLFGQSVNKAWAPTFLAQLTELDGLDGETFRVARSGDPSAPSAPTTDAGRRLWAEMRTRCRGVASVFVVAGAAVIVWGGEVVRPLLAPGYDGAVALIGPIAIGTLAMVLYFIPVNALFYHRRTRLIPVLSASAAVGNVLLNLWWIPRWGALGAAASTAVAYLVLLALFAWAARRISHLPLGWRDVVPLVAVCALALPALWLDASVASIAVRAALKLGLTIAIAAAWFATLRRHASPFGGRPGGG